MLKEVIEQDAFPPKSLFLEFDISVKKHSLSKMDFVVICKLKIDRNNKLWISLLRKMVLQQKTEEFRAAYHESVWKTKPTVSVAVQYALNTCNYALKITHYIQTLADYLDIL